MNKLLSFLLVFLTVITVAEITDAVEYRGVEFPQGAVSFADRVISYNPGSGVESPHNNSSAALGIPDWIDGEDGQFVSLGCQGTLVVKFTDNSLTPGGDGAPDLWIFEIGAAVEPTYVEISRDGTNWIEIGRTSGSTSGIDLDSFIPLGAPGSRFSYVKVIDANCASGSPFAGADIDAVGAISSSTPTFGASLWERSFAQILREGSQAADLEVLRAFRDEVLVKSPAGKQYVDRLYMHSFESALILLTNLDISSRVEVLLQWLTPEIQTLLEDGEMVLYQEDIEEFEGVLDAFAGEASPQFRAFVRKVKMDLRNEKLLEEFGMFLVD